MKILVEINQDSARFKRDSAGVTEQVMKRIGQRLMNGVVEGNLLEPLGGECFAKWKVIEYASNGAIIKNP